MEKYKFLTIYNRELKRIGRFNILNNPSEIQRSEYTFNGEYSDSKRLLHAISSIESTYHNSAADNLDFSDQIVILEYIAKLKKIINTYILDKNTNFDIDIIEEIITLLNLYLGMQIHHYEALIRLNNKDYIERYLITQSEGLYIEIPPFNTTLELLTKLQYTKEPNTYKENQAAKIRKRYQKELDKINNNEYNYLNIYEDIYNNDDNKISKLVINIKTIRKNLFDIIMESKYDYPEKEMLLAYIEELTHAIYNYENFDPEILEMMVEIAHILLNMEVKNKEAFTKLVEKNYVEDYILIDNKVNILSFEETYRILRGFIKLL